MARRQPRKPSIGLNSCSSRARSASFFGSAPIACGDFGDLLLGVRQEFVQRRIEQPDRHRQRAHDLEQLDEIRRAASAEAWRALCGARSRRSARIISRTARMRSSSKNMCSVRHSPMPSAPNLMRGAGVGRRIGIGAHLELAHARRPISSGWRIRRRAPARASRTLAGEHLAGRAVDGERVALLQRRRRRRSWSARGNRRAASRRRRRRACPCRARPRRHARSCRRAWSKCLRRRACRECPRARSRPAPGSPCGPGS